MACGKRYHRRETSNMEAPADPRARIAAAVAERLQALREAHPGVALDGERFAAYLGERLEAGRDPRAALAEAHAADLYLACGCLDGDARAVERFDATVLRPVARAALARLRLSPEVVEEIEQGLRAELLTAAPGAVPALAGYSGRGPLAGWVRVVVVRTAGKWLDRARRERPGEEPLGAASPDEPPDVAAMRALYRDDLRAALDEALAALPARDRNLLRYHHLEGLSIDRLAVMYGIHRATAARQLERARDVLADGMRAALARRLGAEAASCEGVLDLFRSRPDLSLASLLRAEGS
jgi:RNA polymerase sigma-70 factor (ECF subfamily)